MNPDPTSSTNGGLRGASPPPPAPEAAKPQCSRAIPVILSVLAVGAVIGGMVFLLVPRPSPLTQAQERLARIESFRLMRRLDLLRSDVVGMNRQQESQLLFASLSIPKEQRERVALLQEVLKGMKE